MPARGEPWRLERLLLGGAGACARHARACLIVLALVTLASLLVLPSLEIRTDGAALHPAGNPVVMHARDDRITFDDPEEFVLVATPRPGNDPLTTADGLKVLKDLHEEITRLPGIDGSRVRSVASFIDVAASDIGALRTFLHDIPEGEADLAFLHERLATWPQAEGLFLTADGGAAAIYLPLAAGAERQQVASSLQHWVSRQEGSHLDLRLLGPAIAEVQLGELILADLARLVPLMACVMAVLLGACLRTPGALLVAMTKMLVVLAWTLGLMSLARIPLTLVTTVLPVLLLATCLTDEIFVLARLQERIRVAAPESGSMNATDHILAVLAALSRPIILTTATTAIGFLSFMTLSVAPMRQFGMMASVGLLVALLLSFTLTPALVAVIPRSWFLRSAGADVGGSSLDPREPLLMRHRSLALLSGILLVIVAVPGLLRVRIQDSWISNFDPESQLVQAERVFNTEFWGSYRCDIVLSGPEGYFHQPEGVALIARASAAAAEAPGVGGVVSSLAFHDAVAGMLGLAGRARELPPQALQAVVQVGAAYDWPDRQRFGTVSGDAARLLVVVNDPDYGKSLELMERLLIEMERIAGGAGLETRLSGDIPLAVATVNAVVQGQVRSIAWALAAIGLLLLLASRSLRLALIQLAPASMSLVVVLGAMGSSGMPLGIATSMFAALTLGVGVDLALHLTWAHQRAMASGLEPRSALRSALAAAAPAQRWSTLVLSAGFLVLAVSNLAPNRQLGLLLAGAMIASFVFTHALIPRLLAR